MKRTFQPSNLVRARRHGFRSRMATPGGRNVIRARRNAAAEALGVSVPVGPADLRTLTRRADFLAANAGKRAPMPGFVLQVRPAVMAIPPCGSATPSPRKSATPWFAIA